MVFGTMKAHGGSLEIRSQIGSGTTITLTFPRLQEEPEPAPVEASTALAAGQPLAILWVDDDEFILESVELMLGSCGHTVRTAQGGQEALACLDQAADVDLVILDLNMPGMNGAETLTRILAGRPRQRVLLANGYHDGETSQLLADRPGVGFLQKPFSMAEFLKKTADMGI
jgi:CheY-like chemotaxis protein